MNFWERSFSENDLFSFSECNWKTIELSENCLFSLMRQRKISSEMGFLRSTKQLNQMSSWILMCKLAFLIRILDKTSFSKHFILLSNVNPTLNSFQKRFSGFCMKCCVRRCEIIFFADAQPVQKISYCVVHFRLTFFPMLFQFWVWDVLLCSKK